MELESLLVVITFHSINNILSNNSIPSTHKWTLQIDFSDAFNSIDCGIMFQEICARIPGMAAWVECCYGSHPILEFLHFFLHAHLYAMHDIVVKMITVHEVKELIYM